MASYPMLVAGTASLLKPVFPLRSADKQTLGTDKDFDQSMTRLQFDPKIGRREKTGPLSIEALWRTSQDQVATIIQTRQFQNWMASLDSQVLFVNCPSQAPAHKTPSAFVCHQLVQAIDQQRNHIAALAFSCRKHSNQADPEYGVVGLLRSLIGQLLASFSELEVKFQRRNRLQTSELEILYEKFESLFLELAPEVVLFCAIDSINIHEQNKALRDEFEELVEFLLDMSQLPRSCTLKLIMICSWNSHSLYKLMPDQKDTVLWIPCSPPSQGGLTATKWGVFLQRNFQFLS